MKIRTPYNRDDLRIKDKDYVLEIGPGNNPSFRPDVVVDKFIDNNYHRYGDLKIYKHQKFIHADGINLPFKDKEFDYVICNQVLEHVDDPVKFIEEQCRVAKRGYIETPSIIGEFLFPKEAHKWVILDIDNKLVIYEKSKIMGDYRNNYGELFLNYLPYQSLIYKLLWFTEGNLMMNRYEWADQIDYIINPQDDYYSSFFNKKWNKQMAEKIFPRRTLAKELLKIFNSSVYLIKTKLKWKFMREKPISWKEYFKLNNIKV